MTTLRSNFRYKIFGGHLEDYEKVNIANALKETLDDFYVENGKFVSVTVTLEDS